MTAASPLFAVDADLCRARAGDSPSRRKDPARSALPRSREQARAWFAALLWETFRNCRSEAELAERAAPALGVSKKQVRNWLRQEHDPSLTSVMKLLTVAGAEIVLERMERGA